jgi:hypothetical protein
MMFMPDDGVENNLTDQWMALSMRESTVFHVEILGQL